jgi:hypothetical protein
MLLGRILTGSKRPAGHGAGVDPAVGARRGQQTPRTSLATLEAMAHLARQTGLTVHVVLPREPGVVEHAREVASGAGVEVSVDLMAASIRARFVRPGTAG